MSMNIQPKLLRLLEGGSMPPVGYDSEVRVNRADTRGFQTQTAELIEVGSFRRDLYERLNQMTFLVPSLADR